MASDLQPFPQDADDGPPGTPFAFDQAPLRLHWLVRRRCPPDLPAVCKRLASVTSRNAPLLAVRRRAFSRLTGLPMRMAVAMVSGSLTVVSFTRLTRGLEPHHSRQGSAASCLIFLEPHPAAVMLPALPRCRASQASPRASMISVAVFRLSIGIDRATRVTGFFSRLHGCPRGRSCRGSPEPRRHTPAFRFLGDAVRDQDEGLVPPARGRGRCACVARAGTDHGRSHLPCLGHGHATVLEGTGRVQAVVFHEDLDSFADPFSDRWNGNQRCRPFAEGDYRC